MTLEQLDSNFLRKRKRAVITSEALSYARNYKVNVSGVKVRINNIRYESDRYIVEKYKKRGLSPARIHLPMSRHEIANYLGMAPETLSRQFKRFQQNNLITISDKYCEINDEEALKQIAKTCQIDESDQHKQAG